MSSDKEQTHVKLNIYYKLVQTLWRHITGQKNVIHLLIRTLVSQELLQCKKSCIKKKKNPMRCFRTNYTNKQSVNLRPLLYFSCKLQEIYRATGKIFQTEQRAMIFRTWDKGVKYCRHVFGSWLLQHWKKKLAYCLRHQRNRMLSFTKKKKEKKKIFLAHVVLLWYWYSCYQWSSLPVECSRLVSTSCLVYKSNKAKIN